MSKKVHCAKCGILTKTYNRFLFTFAQKHYTYNDTQNIDNFKLCHKCSDALSDWLEFSKINKDCSYE